MKEIMDLSEKQNVPIYMYEGADHSLETGNVMANLEILRDVMKKTNSEIAKKRRVHHFG